MSNDSSNHGNAGDAAGFVANVIVTFKNGMHYALKKAGIPEKEISSILTHSKITGYVGNVAEMAYEVYQGDKDAIIKTAALIATGVIASGLL